MPIDLEQAREELTDLAITIGRQLRSGPDGLDYGISYPHAVEMLGDIEDHLQTIVVNLLTED